MKINEEVIPEIKIKIDEGKLKHQIMRCKKLIASMRYFEDKDKIGVLEKLNQEVCLVVAEFKCQSPKCKSEENLQIHHLILRKAKDFMDFYRYASQRYYWANQIILCIECHKEYHELFDTKVNGEMGCIEQKRIDKIKKKYKFEDAI